MNRPGNLARSAAARFRAEIGEAESMGVGRPDMVLHLTHRDAIKLQRDDQVALADISFLGGEMRYLGVRVVRGGVAESVLVTAEG